MPAIMDSLTEAERTALAEAKRNEGRRNAQEAAESFERCDTDGFLSQWASGISATCRQAEADLIENGGVTNVLALFDLEGNIASTHSFQRQNQYSFSMEEVWRMNDEFVAKGGKRFITLSGARKGKTRYANDAKKGIRLGTIRVRGYVKVVGSYGAARGTILPIVEDMVNGDYDIVSVDRGVESDW